MPTFEDGLNTITPKQPCACDICVRHRRWMAAFGDLNDEAKAALDEIYTCLAVAEDDSCYWEMKFKGTWPGDNFRHFNEKLLESRKTSP